MGELAVTDLFGGSVNMKPKANIKSIAEKFKASDEFDDWLSVLKKKKAATTQNAWNRRLKRVLALIESGQDIQAVFAQSADSGWTGLFEVQNGNQGFRSGNYQRETPVQRSERLEREALGI